jgi:predicted AAA+ superfamily ATPase
MLMEAVSDSLAGRAAVIPFLGLSASEWARAFSGSTVQWIDFLWTGGFPALWAEVDAAPSRDRWYQGYLATYLERDVRSILAVGSLRDFQRFLRACAARIGATLNMAEIGRDVGISATTARQWISVLQASGQIMLLEPYYRSLGKRLVKSPKLFFTDTGLASFLLGFQSPQALWSSREAGFFWENHVIGQWLRWRDWYQPSASLWYWRDQAGNEVDLVIERNDRLLAVECKLSEHPSPRDLRGIAKLRSFYGPEQIEHAYIACTTTTPFDLGADTTAVSGWEPWDLPAPDLPEESQK